MYLEVGDESEEGDANLALYVHGTRSAEIEKDDQFHVKGDRTENVDGDLSVTVAGSRHEHASEVHYLAAREELHLKAGMMVIEADTKLTLKVGGNFVDISPAGVAIQGTIVLINSGGTPGSGTVPEGQQFVEPVQPAPLQAPTPADDARTGFKSCPS